MGSITDIDAVRRRRVVSRFCTECHTPWALRALHRDGVLVIRCSACGHVRATIPTHGPDDAALPAGDLDARPGGGIADAEGAPPPEAAPGG